MKALIATIIMLFSIQLVSAQNSSDTASLRNSLSSGNFYIDVTEIMTSRNSLKVQTDRFFTVFKDSVHVELPYIGTLHTPVIGQNKPKIEFDEAYTDYHFNESKKAFTVNMSVKTLGEHFSIRIKTPRNGGETSLIIEGARRESIRYIGTLFPLKELHNKRNPLEK